MKQSGDAHSSLRSISWRTPSASVIGLYSLARAAFAVWGHLMISAQEPELPMEAWRISFLRSPETFHVQDGPLRPLLAKEVWEILGGRALWTMLLLMCPLVGYSFFQAVSLYGEASTAGLQSPVLASTLSPLDGILVPTLGDFYVAVTLLFPFVAIRALGQEKETGALRLLVQLPYRPSTLVSAKLAAVLVAWTLASIPALSALALWRILGGAFGSGRDGQSPVRPS